MEITTTVTDGFLDIAVDGRLDGYWADHLDRAIADAIREGNHRLRLDCARLTFLSSAGIGVLLKAFKELRRLNGSFQIVQPSASVASALQMANLTALLVGAAGGPAAGAAPHAQPAAAKQWTRDGVGFETYEIDARARLTWQEIGTAEPLRASTFQAQDCHSLASRKLAVAVGIGAFGTAFADCRESFGELVSVAGATAYQPAGDGTVADYLLVDGALSSDVQVLYALGCEGGFSHLVRFAVEQRGATIGLSRLLGACLDAVGSPSIGVAVVAETAGLVGAALRRSPAESPVDPDFFQHPGVRTRLTFTAEPAYAKGVTLAAGVAARGERAASHPLLRPIGPEVVGHVHGAAFQFRPIQKGRIELKETVSGLFDDGRLMGVLHLLRDDRAAAGAGESEFIRGACWIGPLSGPWEAA